MKLANVSWGWTPIPEDMPHGDSLIRIADCIILFFAPFSHKRCQCCFFFPSLRQVYFLAAGSLVRNN